jgi:hypothetical protein
MTQYKKVLECCKKVAVLKTLPAEKCSLDRMLKMFYLKKYSYKEGSETGIL